ncbi:MAG TPA: tryptophan-rich sensory protein [bacterium]|nr:tryptophan-rich sensory protein [bacterium]HPT30113.1 tryptophan-rich sensory protein [bacterium]
MKLKLYYVVIPLLTVLTASVGSQITKLGMGWYNGIALPSFTPPGYVIGIIWTIIFILAALSALWAYSSKKIGPKAELIMILFLASAALNVWWSAFFFGFNLVGVALIELIVLNLVNLLLIILLAKKQWQPALLLLPYFLWVCFAGYLNFLIWRLN